MIKRSLVIPRHCCASSFAGCSTNFNMRLQPQQCKVSEGEMRRHFLTTPIFYVNADPHIGHLYTMVLADAFHRWNLLCAGKSVDCPNEYDTRFQHLFAAGTDEHGRKVEQASSFAHRSPPEHCQIYSDKFLDLFNRFGISNNRFTRTSSYRHRITVQRVWERLAADGWIYKSVYEGWYSVLDECFYSASEIEERDSVLGSFLSDEEPIRVAKETQSPVEWIREENYRFRLGQLTDHLRQWLSQDNVVVPDKFLTMARNYLPPEGSSLPDLSISRPADRCRWAIPVPGDPEQTVYVWFDALCSYLTSADYVDHFESDDRSMDFVDFHWPPDVQIVGKDILRFHAIYWPAFLFALFGSEAALPRLLFVHSHWLVDKTKMSKSRGNVVCPFAAADQLGDDGEHVGVDNLRYFLLRYGLAKDDSNFTLSAAADVVDAELVNDLGNLIQRACAPKLNPDQAFPKLSELDALELVEDSDASEIFQRLRTFGEIVGGRFTDLDFYRGLEWMAETVRIANTYFHRASPWKKSLFSTDVRRAIFAALETGRLCAIHLQPVVPHYSRRLFERLGIPPEHRLLKFNRTLLDDDSFNDSHETHISKQQGMVNFHYLLGDVDGPIWPRLEHSKT